MWGYASPIVYTGIPNPSFPVEMLISELIHKSACGNVKGQRCDCVMPMSDIEELQCDPNFTESNTQL